MPQPSDIEIARAASPRPIQEIGAALGIPPESLIPFGHDKAKLAVVEFEGVRHTLARGQHATSGTPDGQQSVTLAADSRGHFVSEGAVNGRPIRFVDPGARPIQEVLA